MTSDPGPAPVAQAVVRAMIQERLDRFVCAALQGILASRPSGVETPVEVARLALEYAEAAVDELDRSKA